MVNLVRDVKQAWRVVRRRAWSSGLAIALLAVAIGANGTIFSLINAVMLRPLQVREPDRLVSFGQSTFSYRQFDELRRRIDSFESLFAWSAQTVTVGRGDRTDRRTAFVVTGEFFSGLGVRPLIGRPLLPADDAPGGGEGSRRGTRLRRVEPGARSRSGSGWPDDPDRRCPVHDRRGCAA
jgi:hypothetical protein